MRQLTPRHCSWSNGEAAIIVGDALPTVDPYETFKNAGHMHSLELKLRPTGISEPVDCRQCAAQACV